MAINTYATLQSSIANWLDRSDLTDRIPDFIALAEARINRVLRVRQMETVKLISMLNGVKRIALPSDYKKMRGLKYDATQIAETTLNGDITDSATSIVLTDASSFPSSGTIKIGDEQITYSSKSTHTLTVSARGANSSTAAAHSSGATVVEIYTDWTLGTISAAQTTIYPLSYVSPEVLANTNAGSSAGVPSVYTMAAGYILFGPVPSSVYRLEMLYYAAIPALSDDEPTNWCLTANPDLFLYGSLLEASPYLMDDARIQTAWAPAFGRAVQDLQDQDAQDQFSGSELRVRNFGPYP